MDRIGYGEDVASSSTEEIMKQNPWYPDLRCLMHGHKWHWEDHTAGFGIYKCRQCLVTADNLAYDYLGRDCSPLNLPTSQKD